jgi:hypothetical protein
VGVVEVVVRVEARGDAQVDDTNGQGWEVVELRSCQRTVRE